MKVASVIARIACLAALLALGSQIDWDVGAGKKYPHARRIVSEETLPEPVAPWYRAGEEPRIRVGLFRVVHPVLFRSTFAYRALDASGERLSIPRNTPARIGYADGRYRLTRQGKTITSSSPLRLEPERPEVAHFKLGNGSGKDSHEYRDTFELRRSKKGKVWAINELGLEPYVAGIEEVPASWPMEVLRAQALAARSYAFRLVSNGSKYPGARFHAKSTEQDQVYRGYWRERTAPRFARAARETSGQMVTYHGKVAVTNYFARSNGVTRSSKSVWGKHRPYLVPVRTKYDRGHKRNGHGVGMSQWDAYGRARAEGLDYQQLLAYYYTGTKVSELY